MYSGNDTVDYPTQWALNPVAYQNMANDQVDWAALAQQWIQMKETCPPVARPVPQAPPPPPIMVLPGIEGGEAPMEVEGGDPEAPAPPTIAPQQWNNSMSDSTWGNSWNQWSGWGWPQAPVDGNKAPLIPSTPDPPYSRFSTTDTNFSSYTTPNVPQPPFATGYWTSEDGGNESRPRTSRRHSPPSVPRHISSASSSSRRPHQARVNAVPHPVPPPISMVEDTTQTIDAAKRRQLPAWIREGLEKMEREKQKQLDKEREHKEREDYLRMKRLEEEHSLQNQPDDGVPRLPAKSKFDTDSEGSDVEEKIEKEGEKVDVNVEVKVPPPLLQKSQEEIMQDVMLTVRRTLTEILLDVTTEQILSVCKEELSRNRSQPQATRAASVASKSQALSAIGGGLGLGIYGDSSDSGSDSEDAGGRTPDNRQRERSEDITDGQLQETIRRRKADFEKTICEIEARIADEEASLRRHRRTSPGTPKSPTPRVVSKPAEQECSTSDGEGTTTNNRKEQNNSHHKKFTNESTPPIADTKRSTLISEKITRRERKTRDSTEKKVKSQENTDIERKYKVAKKEPKEKDTKKYEKIIESHEKIKTKSPKKSKQEENESGSSSSDSSDSSSSDSDSFLNDSQKRKNAQSGSNSSVSANSVSSDDSSSGSDTESVTKRQSKKKKRKSSSERRKAKKSKRYKSRTKKEDRHKSSKHEKTESDKFDLGDKTVETLKRREYDYNRQESVAGGSHKSSRHSTQTPEKILHKSKYSRKSRSKSEEKHYKRYEKNKKYDDEGRSRDYRSRERRDRSRDRRGRSREGRGRSKDRRGRSREGRDRSRDWRDRSRDGRDRSRDGRDKSRDGRDRSREGRGRSKDRWERSREGRDREKEDRKEKREGRSYYY